MGTPTTNKKWRVDIDLASPTGNNWAQLRGSKNVAPNINNTVQDATDNDDDIWGSDAVTGRKWSIGAIAMRKEYDGAGYDPAQEYLRAMADDLEVVHVRWYERGVTGGEAYEGIGLVQWEPQAGDPTSLSEVNVTILGQGGRTPITNPFSEAAAPVVNGLSPTGGAAAGGDNVVISGTGFSTVTGPTGVKFDTTNATEYTVVSDSTIVAKAPAHAAGSVQVKVTNPDGASVDTAGDDFLYA